MPTSHRKRRRVFNVPGHAHYLTFSCYQGLPLLSRDQPRSWLIEAIRIARARHRFSVFAYVIMPEHVHLLVWPQHKEYAIEKFLYDVKRPVSVKAKRHLVVGNRHDWIDRLTVKRGKQTVFRFWQSGGGFDRNLTRRRNLWPVTEYIHANPVRRGLVERPTDWVWSSAAYWEGMEACPLRWTRWTCEGTFRGAGPRRASPAVPHIIVAQVQHGHPPTS